ncbi:uncharacterized protein LOC134719763 [Mytilus trossulus]|uniref:uncharacterized protein LOC134719763 n=1 Tax=Mytilus trossulus TaxID=6551 RepID=UPI00300705E2
MVHLLFRLACPVVRMVLNHEIKPEKLQKTLDDNKGEMTKKHRRKTQLINKFQWDLLYKGTKIVTSEDFDIKLMIHLLRTLAKIEIGDNEPNKLDNRKGAMLSRIMFIRNETTLSFEGRLPQDKFDKYWNDIGEAILNLFSSHKHEIVKDKKRKNLLIGRLLELNPINIDIKQLRLFIVMSEIIPALILQKIISEFCNSNKTTIEALLEQTKHELYHKRIKTAACCLCKTSSPQINRVIPEKQWEALFENSDQLCSCEHKKCSERFVPKKGIETSDLAVSVPLIEHVPNILNYVRRRICDHGFDTFLIHYQHSIYHLMETKKCCQCDKVPTEKSLINKTEWNKLFLKEDNKNCQEGTIDCCCQFTVREGIKYSNFDEMLLYNLFVMSGPIRVLNKTRNDPLLHFLNWTKDNKTLQGSLKELCNIIEDRKFCRGVSQSIASRKISQVNKTLTDKVETQLWINKNMRNQTIGTTPQCHVIVHEQDDLHVKCVHITPDFPFPTSHRSKRFTNLTTEENNFLLVVHGLTKIAYPVIKQEFNDCSEEDLEKVRRAFNDHQKENETTTNKKRVCLTQDQRIQLNSEKEQITDLKLMIYILKQINDEKEYGDQLDAIDNIRREIVQSSSGILKKDDLKDKMKRLKKAVLHLGGEKFKKKLSCLLRIENTLNESDTI